MVFTDAKAFVYEFERGDERVYRINIPALFRDTPSLPSDNFEKIGKSAQA